MKGINSRGGLRYVQIYNCQMCKEFLFFPESVNVMLLTKFIWVVGGLDGKWN